MDMAGPRVTATPAPAPGNLFFRAAKTSTREELKKQLIDECRDRGLKYGYFVDTLGPRLTPRMLLPRVGRRRP